MAIVLTYNAPGALQRCIEAIESQSKRPDELLVVDNASQPRADPTFASDIGSVARSQENSGPAGGHAIGLSRFLHSGCDIAWVMDDDCVPQGRCLETLLDEMGKSAGPSLVFPRWLDEATGRDISSPAWCGFLIPRDIVEAVGLPRAEFFWWIEDTEYLQWRIPQAGFSVLNARDAMVLHSAVRRGTNTPAWKYYYQTRNAVFYRLYIQRRVGRRFYRLARILIRTPARIVLKEDDKLVKMRHYARGIIDGLAGRLGRTVDVPVGVGTGESDEPMGRRDDGV